MEIVKSLGQQHLHQHEQTHGGTSTGNSSAGDKNTIFKKLKRAFKNRIQTYSFENSDEKFLFAEEFIKKA